MMSLKRPAAGGESCYAGFFFNLAQEHGFSVYISKGDKMVLNTSSKRLNADLGNWNTAIVTFHDFIVALFMDQQLNEDNIIAVNRKGTTRWKISDIIKQPTLSYSALSKENAKKIIR